MITEIERPSQFRVLMRVPRLRHHLPTSEPAEPTKPTNPENEPPKLEYEVTEVTQQVVEDIATVRGSRWVRPVVLVQVFVVIIAVAIALLSRQGATTAPNDLVAPDLQIPTVTLPTMTDTPPHALVEPVQTAVSTSGGSPDEITNAPELTLPADTVANADQLLIERLPPVVPEGPTFSPIEGLSPAATPSANGQQAPGVAQLDKRIETPKPDAHYDSPRPGLY